MIQLRKQSANALSRVLWPPNPRTRNLRTVPEVRQSDIALLDLKMPGMDGLTLYRKIKKLSARTVAIIVSVFASNASSNEALSAGALKVLAKPVDFPKLLGLMDRSLERPLTLLVDDDEELCDSLWDLLNEHGTPQWAGLTRCIVLGSAFR